MRRTRGSIFEIRVTEVTLPVTSMHSLAATTAGISAASSLGMVGASPDRRVTADGEEALELVRAQETELPQALKWQVARADEDYDAALVEARRITGECAYQLGLAVELLRDPGAAHQQLFWCFWIEL